MLFGAQEKDLFEQLEELTEAVRTLSRQGFCESYITNEELMKMLDISANTARSWRKKKLLPFAFIGKKCYYRLSDINQLFEESFENSWKRQDWQIKKRATYTRI
jgi:hypothetical protein